MITILSIYLMGGWDHSHTIKKRGFYTTIKTIQNNFSWYWCCHQHETTGQFYLEYLETNGLKIVKNKLTLESIRQGERFYEKGYEISWGNVGNFVGEYDKLNGEKIIMDEYCTNLTKRRYRWKYIII